MKFCDVRQIMDKDEHYARGWLKLYSRLDTETAAEMGQYAVDLLKLKNAHMKRCAVCRENYK